MSDDSEKPEESELIREYTISSGVVECREIDTDGSPLVHIAGMKRQWQFGYKSGALLMMSNYRIISLPQSVKDAISDSKHPKLNGVSVVTRVYIAQAYIFYLSNGYGEKIDMNLVIHPPTLAAPRATLGFKLSTLPASCWNGISPNRQCDFTPLFELEAYEKMKKAADRSSD